jgi:hypothetical protein
LWVSSHFYTQALFHHEIWNEEVLFRIVPSIRK